MRQGDALTKSGDLMGKAPRDLKGPEPDFSEEGWAMRKPRKNKNTYKGSI